MTVIRAWAVTANVDDTLAETILNRDIEEKR